MNTATDTRISRRFFRRAERHLIWSGALSGTYERPRAQLGQVVAEAPALRNKARFEAQPRQAVRPRRAVAAPE